MTCGRRNIRNFIDDRTGSATTKLAAGACAIVLASLILGEELARWGQASALSKLNVARNAPTFQNREVDFTPTGAIKRPGRTPCGEEE